MKEIPADPQRFMEVCTVHLCTASQESFHLLLWQLNSLVKMVGFADPHVQMAQEVHSVFSLRILTLMYIH